MSRNVTDALVGVLDDINARGRTVAARGSEQREILSALVTIDRPRERVLTIPHRNNNVFAQIAETLWVLAGRNDLDFLSRYLPRAAEFSDDGKTWRAAYGPRLRAWDEKVDQLAQVHARLAEDAHTKRAVATIFDPALDYVDTLDVPCNNWLHFIQRDSTLHLNVAVRANDAIWGFSGINTFEWSVLHEIMASSLGWAVGRMSWFVGTMHIYERHYDTANRIMRHSGIRSVYDFGMAPIPIQIGLDQLDDVLQQVFTVEGLARAGSHRQARAENALIRDPFFNASATMLRAYLAFAEGDAPEAAFEIVGELPSSDFRLAAIEYLSRRLRTRTVPLSPVERDYMNYHWAMRDAVTALSV
ncbi:thymidylate synthase [Sphaerisporangium sp. NPDC004334]